LIPGFWSPGRLLGVDEAFCLRYSFRIQGLTFHVCRHVPLKEFRMNRKLVVVIAAILLSAMVLAGALAAEDVLKAGQYTAKVKAIVCGGCGPLIVKTLQGFKELDAITVDPQASTLQFTVKKDSTAKFAEIQKALNAAADQMKMGADYTLKDLKRK
jgi:hypothetical protein